MDALKFCWLESFDVWNEYRQDARAYTCKEAHPHATWGQDSSVRNKFQVNVYGALAFVSGDAMALALNNDTYWAVLPLSP